LVRKDFNAKSTRLKSLASWILFLAVMLLSFSCSKNTAPVIITLWTNKTEVVSYAELFNASQNKEKVIVIYKEDLLEPLETIKKENRPDILLGSYLLEAKGSRYFSAFSKADFDENLFYPELINIGHKDKRQYLLPVSFNLPALVFDVANSEYIQDEHFISFDRVKEISKEFNAKSSDGTYTKMAFGAKWNQDFLALVFKEKGFSFSITNGELSYDEGLFNSTLTFLENWTNETNTSSYDEQDFSFKYLLTPFYKQISTNRSLFAYSTSNQIMKLSEEKLSNIDFRWVCNDSKIFIEDDIVMAGVYKKSANKDNAKRFISWLLTEETQKRILERKAAMHLDTSTFGIADGFSSLINVNEKLFPIYYKLLLTNVPVSDLLQQPQFLSKSMNETKEEILLPYIKDILNDTKTAEPLNERFTQWYKQHNL